MAEHDYASKIRHDGHLFHGGLDAEGNYKSPRTLNRTSAVALWTARLKTEGQRTQVMDPAPFDVAYFPNAEQAKLLMKRGVRGPMARTLTIIGITEGYGNSGLMGIPRPELQPLFKESIENTCLDHLYKGLFEAHGKDEAGSGDEKGHDHMWFAIRDAALEKPDMSEEMKAMMPAKGSGGSRRPQVPQRKFPQIDAKLEALLGAMSRILAIELGAYVSFRWAIDVLSDPQCSADPDFARTTVEHIQQDENIHVAYLQCGLAEARSRTIIGIDGKEIPGKDIIDPLCAVSSGPGAQLQRRQMQEQRMGRIREDLKKKDDGDKILKEFAALGPVPSPS